MFGNKAKRTWADLEALTERAERLVQSVECVLSNIEERASDVVPPGVCPVCRGLKKVHPAAPTVPVVPTTDGRWEEAHLGRPLGMWACSTYSVPSQPKVALTCITCGGTGLVAYRITRSGVYPLVTGSTSLANQERDAYRALDECP